MLTECKLPNLGENINSGTVTRIMVTAGQAVRAGENILELETEKAVLEVPSPAGGVVKEIFVKTNDNIKVGQAILSIETDAETGAAQPAPINAAPLKEENAPAAPQRPQAPSPAVPAEPVLPARSGPVKDVAAAPSVRAFAREIGIDIFQVPGSGPNSRISIDDVKAFAKAINTSRAYALPPAGVAAAAPALVDFSRWGEIERKPLSQIRRKTAEHLSYAWSAIPHVTQFDKADITELDNLRKRFSKKVEDKGGKLTVTAFIVKVVASALKAFAPFNASLDTASNEVIYKKYYHIGIAVDTERGLLVPVIRDADKKSIVELAVELTQISQKARDKKLALEDMQGGTFTITNLGSIGGGAFTPIINYPEVAILGVSRAAIETHHNGTYCTPRLMLPLSLSYDHRVIDGADGARFMRRLVDGIEQPFITELEG